MKEGIEKVLKLWERVKIPSGFEVRGNGSRGNEESAANIIITQQYYH